MNSFIGWIGGKRLLRDKIIARFPADVERYIEVFGGAGWVLFRKEIVTGQLEIFNDADSQLINLYRCIKYHREELLKELEYSLHSREYFFDYQSQLKCKGLTDIQRAARYLYIIKSSFGNDRRSFATGKKSLESTKQYILKVQERLFDVVIENKDFEGLIKTYDRPKALFYLDPPYVSTEKMYDLKFNEEDHKRLCKSLSDIKGRFLLSYNDCAFIRELYVNFNVKEISRSNSLSNRADHAVYKELLIRNY